MTRQNNNFQNGFIALMSVVILSAVMIMVTITLGTVTYFSRMGEFNNESKELSYFLAYTCIDYAEFQLTIDLDYPGNEILTVGDYQCGILPITKEDGDGHKKKKGKNRRVTTTATVLNSTTTLQKQFDMYLDTIYFKEF